ncbi:uncharacterized protein LOC114194403 [Vigna unguiculata]|uniref:VQ domain-containing protein n=1 Tax=Vigna unguiculata TaxID=3917 RepID=A0A4D6MK55_VIGUN|nr:uncharacterized protein LOC114194403 [Vigna unguiculata]QCE01920.1 hypothetical protein DEO72_LG7g3220 [Vigna unguiculata]
MSGPIPNDQWLHFYQQAQFSGGQELLPSSVSEATAVTTTVAPAQLSPEGRVSKPIRRRYRASRRTPTTLLNTDTTNFRAMVQRFTGAPSSPDLFGPTRPLPVNPNGLMLAPSHSLQQQQQQQLYQHYPTAYAEGGENGLFQRLSNATASTAANDGGGVLMEHARRFLPNRNEG